MKVYVLLLGENNEDGSIVDIYLSKEKALKALHDRVDNDFEKISETHYSDDLYYYEIKEYIIEE